MNKKDKKKIINLYNKRIYDDKISKIKKIGWGSKSSQNLRFKILSNKFNLNNKSILDLGCGYGDFYSFLKNVHNQYFW